MTETPGYRFHPFDRELITDYLMPKIMGTKFPCNMIKEKEVYGPSLSLNPWRVFDTNDRDSWFRWPGLKETEKCMFVFVKLCKISKSNTTTWKNTSKRAGCGTWVCKGKKQDQIVDFEGKVIGEKRYLIFTINDIGFAEVGLDLSKIGHYKMHEYSLIGDNAGSMVLCRITYDSSKECPVNLKPGFKSANHVSSSSEAQIKEENNTNNFEGAGIAKVENLTVLDSGVSVGEKLEESGNSSVQNLAVVVDSCVCGNLEGSSTLISENLVATNSDVSEPFAAAQYNNGLQELNKFGQGFGFDDLGGLDFCLDGLDDCDFMACPDPNIQEAPYRDIQDSGVSVGEKLGESGTSTTQNLCVGGNLVGSRSLTSESLVAINSDVSEPFDADQYNNGLQELNNFGEGFGFDDLDGLDFCLDGLDVCDFMACLDRNIQEEPSRDSSGRKLKRKFENEENLYQSKKMCLANPN